MNNRRATLDALQQPIRAIEPHSRYRLDLGEFDAFSDDVADLAFEFLEHSCIRGAQGLLHLHRLKNEDRRPFIELCALLREERNHRAWQRCCDLVLADLLLGFAAERIDPMQVEAAISGPQV